MRRCIKCGTELERGKRHTRADCRDVRSRRAAAVTADVELMRRKNWAAINRTTGSIGQRGGHPPPGQTGGGPQSMVV